MAPEGEREKRENTSPSGAMKYFFFGLRRRKDACLWSAGGGEKGRGRRGEVYFRWGDREGEGGGGGVRLPRRVRRMILLKFSGLVRSGGERRTISSVREKGRGRGSRQCGGGHVIAIRNIFVALRGGGAPGRVNEGRVCSQGGRGGFLKGKGREEKKSIRGGFLGHFSLLKKGGGVVWMKVRFRGLF